MSRVAIVIIAIIGLFSCRKTETVDEQKENRFGVEALVISGENRASLRLFMLDDSQNLNLPENLVVTLEGPGTEYTFTQTDDHNYVLEAPEPPIYANAPYALRIDGEDVAISASTRTPPGFNWIDSPMAQFNIDPGNPDAILDLISWQLQEDYEYLLKLEYLGENADPIPFLNNSFDFEEDFAFPIPDAGIPLYAGYFKNYGPYKISIYAVSKEYVAYFFPVDEGVLPLLESNIDGAFGYFSGVTAINFVFEVVE